MEKKKLIQFINETISSHNFDFLGLQSSESEEEILKTLNNYSFQKKFLYDLFFNKKNIETDTSDATIKKEIGDDFNNGFFKINYSIGVEYEYKDKTYYFDLDFYGEQINYVIKESEKDGRKRVYIDWDSIDFDAYTPTGDLIDFHIFDKVENKIERQFIKEFIGYFIETELME